MSVVWLSAVKEEAAAAAANSEISLLRLLNQPVAGVIDLEEDVEEDGVRAVLMASSFDQEEARSFLLPAGFLYSLNTSGEWEHFGKYGPAPEGQQFVIPPVQFGLELGDPIGVFSRLLSLSESNKPMRSMDRLPLQFAGVMRSRTADSKVWAMVASGGQLYVTPFEEGSIGVPAAVRHKYMDRTADIFTGGCLEMLVYIAQKHDAVCVFCGSKPCQLTSHL